MSEVASEDKPEAPLVTDESLDKLEEFPTMISDGEDEDYEVEEEVTNPEDAYPHNTLVWKIDNFAKLYSPEFADEYKKQPFILSPSTTTADFEWGVKIFPKGWEPGIGPVDGDYLALFIEIRNDKDVESGRKTKYGRFTIEFNNSKDPNDTESHSTSHIFQRMARDFGWPKFALRKKLLNEDGSFLQPDGSITITVKFVRLPDPEQITSSDYLNKDYRKNTGYVGLRNQGATCYMNSLLQTLYHTTAFARAVFMLPTEHDDPTKSIPLALQRVFFNLKYSPVAVSTTELTQSFGWSKNDSFQQHDVQELNRKLTDNLEEKMRGTPAEGLLGKLLSGVIEHRIHCTQVDFDSCREEVFYDLSLDVQGCRDLQQSLDKYTEVELLEGENAYSSEKYGRQPAEKGCKFLKLPPVLHLQLKRWVYDVYTDSSKKINDKFDFPVTIDFERYLAPGAPRDQPSIYELHAVLIHSGSAGGGHYYLFMRPTPKNKWFQFNDERVTPVKMTAAMEEGFGGGSEFSYIDHGKTVMSFTKPNTSAYMLVYIRKSEVHDVLYHLHSSDIPYHLHKRFANDALLADVKKKEEKEAYISKFIRLVTEKNLREFRDSRDLFNPDSVIAEAFPMDMSFADFYAAVAKKYGVSVSAVRLYPFERRKNLTYRILPCLPLSEDTPLRAISIKKFDIFVLILSDTQVSGAAAELPGTVPSIYGSTKEEKAAYYAQFSRPKPKAINALNDKRIILFVKRYDPATEKVNYVGMLPIENTCDWGQALERLKQLVGVAPDSDLLVFDDRSSNERIDGFSQNVKLKDLRIRHGDVLVVQTPPPPPMDGQPEPRYPLFPVFVYFTSNLTAVKFIPLNTSDPNGRSVSLRLPTTLPYKDIVKLLAESLKVDPGFIRLTQYNTMSRGPEPEPYKRDSAPHLNDILRLGGYYSTDLILYEVLDIPLEEAEKLCEVRFNFYDIHVKSVGEHLVRLPSSATVVDVLKKAEELHPSQSEAGGSGQYRLCEVVGNKLKELNQHMPVTLLKAGNLKKTYRVEEIPKEEIEMDPKTASRIMITHFETDINGYASLWGDPFFFVVPFGMTVKDLRPLIKEKIQMPDDVVPKVKFAIISWVTPSTLAEHDPVVREKGLSDGSFLGLMHTNTEKKFKKRVYHYAPKEQSLVING